ncbi:MAG: MoaD/ThiS family protein [Anaerolineae bacterium]|nr:MoaD/ThiS family protein [Anaerolineae bacterium]
MPQVTLRFFGFGGKASGFETRTEEVREGTSLGQLWETLRASAARDDLLARIDETRVTFIHNGELVSHENVHETPLKEGDTVALMVLAVGG